MTHPLPTAFNDCTCHCHTQPGVMHMMACCSPNTVHELIDELEQRQIDANLQAYLLGAMESGELIAVVDDYGNTLYEYVYEKGTAP